MKFEAEGFVKIGNSGMSDELQPKAIAVWDGRIKYGNAYRITTRKFDKRIVNSFHYAGARVLTSSNESKRKVPLRDIIEAVKEPYVKTVILMVPVFEENVSEAVERLHKAANVVLEAIENFEKSGLAEDDVSPRKTKTHYIDEIWLVGVKPSGIFQKVIRIKEGSGQR